MNLTRTGHTYRGIVILFLLVVCADLACPPPVCCAGEEPAAGSHALAAARDSDDGRSYSAASVDAPDAPGQDGREQSAPCCGDDCFCCGHATQGAGHTQFASLDQRSPYGATLAVRLPSPPLRSTFHPPRFA